MSVNGTELLAAMVYIGGSFIACLITYIIIIAGKFRG